MGVTQFFSFLCNRVPLKRGRLPCPNPNPSEQAKSACDWRSGSGTVQHAFTLTYLHVESLLETTNNVSKPI